MTVPPLDPAIERLCWTILELGLKLAAEMENPPSGHTPEQWQAYSRVAGAAYPLDRFLLDAELFTTRQQIVDWRHRFYERIEAIAYLAVEIIEEEDGSWGPAEPARSCCPLCRATTATGAGFLLPRGLQQHLIGFGNIKICPVAQGMQHLTADLAQRLEDIENK